MKKLLSIMLWIAFLLWISLANANDIESTTITLKPWLNTFSTPAIIKSISFSNEWDKISFSKMEKGQWKSIAINNNTLDEVRPLDGFIIRNSNSNDVIMTIEYDTDNSNSLVLSKELDVWWNFLWITTTTNPFNVIANAAISMVLDLTNWWSTNLIELWKTFINAQNFILWKAYAVFVNNSDWIYWWVNNYGNNTNNNTHSYSAELTEAYGRAYENWIISEDSMDNAGLYDSLNNGELAGIMVNFSNYLWIVFDGEPTDSCWFTSEPSQEVSDLCQMYYLWRIDDSRVTLDDVDVNATQATFVTALSRAIRGSKNNWWDPYYANHLAALQDAGIVNEINNPETAYVIKWYALLTLKRVIDLNYNAEIPYSAELTEAYGRAYENWIISEDSMDNAGLFKRLNNGELVGIMVNFSNYLWFENSTDSCSFTSEPTQQESDLCLMYWLWRIDDSRVTLDDVDSFATQATFVTALSRATRGSKNNWWDPYYANHLAALQDAGIVNEINNPETAYVIKWDVLLKLKRVTELNQ